ncbi:hypothetical protein [Nonomuraea sp. SYSU D8015]|uniref:hypothetical protein n=1 Tax=Nonomuraea sp. SYSU D8015 TaxID=2593644 RepID=UPI00166018F3|nr:hypothetical protein [Nonomuraea sp. SYSU D8015]
MTGYTGAYKAGSDKRDPEGYNCGISNEEQSIVLTSYDVSARRELIDNFMRRGAKEGRVKIPRELGVGEMSDYEIRLHPYRTVGAWFRCGNKNSLITIYVRKNPARDQDHDLVQLMEIAQRRFAEMFSCKPGGPPPVEKSR